MNHRRSRAPAEPKARIRPARDHVARMQLRPKTWPINYPARLVFVSYRAIGLSGSRVSATRPIEPAARQQFAQWGFEGPAPSERSARSRRPAPPEAERRAPARVLALERPLPAAHRWRCQYRARPGVIERGRGERLSTSRAGDTSRACCNNWRRAGKGCNKGGKQSKGDTMQIDLARGGQARRHAGNE